MNESIIVKMGLDNSAFNRGLDRSRGALSKLNGALGAVGAGVAIGGLIAGFRKLVQLADDINTKAGTLGVSTKFIQEWGQAAEQAGVSLAKAEKGFERFVVRIGEAKDGTKEVLKAFREIGVSLEPVNGQMKSNEQLISEVADGLANISDSTVKARIAYDLFGKSGVEMLKMLEGGAAGLEKFKQAASGKIIGQEQLDALNNANVALKDLEATLTAAAGNIVGGIGKLFADLGTASVEVFHGSTFLDDKAIRNIELSAKRARGKLKEASDGTIFDVEEAEAIKKAMEQVEKAVRNLNYSRKSDQEQLAILKDEERSIQEQISGAGMNQLLSLELTVALNEKKLEILNKQLAIEGAINKATEDRMNAQKALQSAQDNRSKFFGSVSDIAGLDLSKGGTLEAVRNKRIARAVLQREQLGERFKALGADEQSKRQFAEADRMRNFLTMLSPESRDPFQAQKQALSVAQKQVEMLARIDSKIPESGTVLSEN